MSKFCKRVVVLLFQGYIANYTGHTKIDRLVFIANKSAGTPLEVEALKIAHDELKKVARFDGRSSDLVTGAHGAWCGGGMDWP